MATLTQEKQSATAMQINAMMDAADLAHDLQAPFALDDIKVFGGLGINLVEACIGFLYSPVAQENGFTRSLFDRIKGGRRLSEPQIIQGLNVMREGILGLKPSKTSPLPIDETREIRCHTNGCGMIFDDRGEYVQHRMDEHGYKPGEFSVDKAYVDPVSVLEVTEGKLGLDLSGTPSGNFAIFKGDENSGYHLFFKVRRVKKGHRDRRYRTGMDSQRVGTEIVPAGTIEVRNVTGATEQLIGYQKPGELYIGQYEFEIEEYIDDPKYHARLFAREREVCMICGRKLTDEASRNDLIGPECFKQRTTHWQRDYWLEVSQKLRENKQNVKPHEPVRDFVE